MMSTFQKRLRTHIHPKLFLLSISFLFFPFFNTMAALYEKKTIIHTFMFHYQQILIWNHSVGSHLKIKQHQSLSVTVSYHITIFFQTFSSRHTWTSSGDIRRMVVSARAFILATGMVKTRSQERTQATEWTTARMG